jgi:hypothetical protein
MVHSFLLVFFAGSFLLSIACDVSTIRLVVSGCYRG